MNDQQQFLRGPQVTPEIIRDSKTIQCDCGGFLFIEKMMFKKISAIISPTGKEEMVPMAVIVCDKCGKVPEIFDSQNILPKEIRAKKVTKK
jgi:hypothetical protein